jgi:glutamate-ammonia-ligase adenylyltransferase
VLLAWNVRDAERGCHNLTLQAGRLGRDRLGEFQAPLGRFLPRCPDPDRALNNLERFFANPASLPLVPQLLENRARSLEILVQLFGTSQMFSDLLVQYPDYLDMIRVPLRRSPSCAELRDQLQAEIANLREDSAVLRAFRRFRQRQLLRIGTNDIVRERPLEEVTRDISRVADIAIEVALCTALRTVSKRFGQPMGLDGRAVSCVALAFGKLGGEELNYSSDIDLMFLYGEEGQTRGPRGASIPNDEFFGRVVSEVVRLLAAHTPLGQAFRVDLRLRPEGQRGPLARSLSSTLSYYDSLGRTWERQALIKLRPVAGDLPLGQRFLLAIEPFVYRKYLSYAEINEIKAMKRRIEQKASRDGASETEVKTGHGGIRDIEFTIQFLQLLNGGDLPELRQRNTLAALHALEQAGCLTDQEYRVLDDAYRFLRKTEHRLQLLFDLQTHRLPESDEEVRKLALRMGYAPPEPPAPGEIRPERRRSRPGRGVLVPAPVASPPASGERPDPREAFLKDYRDKTEPTRRILDHLLHQTFAGEHGAGEEGEVAGEPESDLLLDPNPDPETIRSVLGKYPFRDIPGAYANLAQLAQESVRFLSARRCRHFLASIAPALLQAIAETPDPDLALLNLEKVTHSLGAKTVLWELFSFNKPSLKLYVDLCAWSQFLSEILINNPGMIDELLDSLVLNQPRGAQELREELALLCRGATDLEPILHSFQDKELLRLGVRDILGKDSIHETAAALSDLAETILVQVASPQPGIGEKRYGVPALAEGPRAGQRARFALLALGKLGGREMNYHSDLDLMMIYEGDGRTAPPPGATRFDRFELTDNFHFFTELAQRIIKATSYLGPMGRLYQVDMRLRPTGKSGSLVLPISEFRRYFDQGAGHAQLWERQALTRCRVVFDDGAFGQEVMAAVEEAAYGRPWQSADTAEILDMRQRLEASRSVRDLKRGPGGMADVEFLVQLYQLKYGSARPELRTPNTRQALGHLRAAGVISDEEYETLRTGYDFLLRVQGRLRMMHSRSRDEIPEPAEDREKLARRLGFENGAQFLAELRRQTGQVRELFVRLMERSKDEG